MKRGLSQRSAADKRAALKKRLDSGDFIAAPGVFDMISARIADGLGFDALYMTGYGTVASSLGLPDAGLASSTEMAERVSRFAAATDAPLICDADTGFGGLLNVMHTVRTYEAAGASAIQIEDQEFPKKCGHMLGRRVTAAQDMVEKIRVAVETREDPGLLIVARTDARTSLGLDEALRRAEAYARAGADMLFIESPESVEEMERIGHSFHLPLVANMVEGGRTPMLDADTLAALGYRVAIFPATGFLAAGAALQSAYGSLKAHRSSQALEVPLYPFPEFSRLMGFDWVAEFDQAHAAREDRP